jgi:hypothetical protein
MGGRDRGHHKSRKGDPSRCPQTEAAMTSESETDKLFSEILGILEKRFENGDKTAILMGIEQCLLMERSPPEWLRLAFLQAYRRCATYYETRSWDEAFGLPHPKGTHLKKERRDLFLRSRIVARFRELKAERRPTDKGLFERIGKELEINGTTASDIYYDERTQKVRDFFDFVTKAIVARARELRGESLPIDLAKGSSGKK